MNDLYRQIENLSLEKQERLLRMLDATKGPEQRILLRRLKREGAAFRASFAQQRLWFLDQLEPGSPYYNICRAFSLNGPLQVSALESGLNEMVRRHEALHTVFAQRDGQLMQVITPFTPLSLAPVQLEGASPKEVIQRVSQEALTPFDLVRGPLIRVTLLRTHAQEHVFIVTMHHIISDGWSIGLFFRELSLLYQATVAGQRVPLPELSVQYVDYAHWQREWLQGERLEAQQIYWLRQLKGTPEILSLPTDRSRPAIQTFRGAAYPFTLAEELSRDLKELSQREGVTLFMTTLAAFNILLYQYSGQEDLVVGSSIANRGRVEIEKVIGFFVNTLVLRTSLATALSFSALLKQVQTTTTGAYEHQDLPFEQLVELLRPKRNRSISPLFQVLFELQSAPEMIPHMTGISVRALEFERGFAKFDLTLTLVDNGPRLQGDLEYNTDLFDALTITRMAKHWQSLLRSIVEHPEWRISDLPRLEDAYLPMHRLSSHTETVLPRPQTQDGTRGRERASSTFNAPQNSLEQTIAHIWQEVLAREKVGLFENFFDLGGHSFLVLQVHSQLSERLHLEFPVVDLFNYPTISSLAEYLASIDQHKSTTVRAGQNHASARREAMQRRQKTHPRS